MMKSVSPYLDISLYRASQIRVLVFDNRPQVSEGSCVKTLHWCEHALADDGCPQVDTGWAATCFLCILMERGSRCAVVGHLFSRFEGERRDDARRAQGATVAPDRTPHLELCTMFDTAARVFSGGTSGIDRIVIRGNSRWFEGADGPATHDEDIRFQDDERRVFLHAVTELRTGAGLPEDVMDICWAEDGTETRIVYDATTGEMQEESRRTQPPSLA